MYAWTGHGNGPTAYTQNGLNQQLTVGGAAAAYDTKGNLTSEPQSGKTYGYSSENLLTSATGGVTLAYDPAMRLYQTVGAATTRFLYDGVDAIAEYNASNALQRRFVFDPITDQPVLWYEGTGTASTNRRYLSQDERGSVISVSGSTGASLGINTYDEYGKPGAANLGRFQYTGQKWVGEANLYDYKARDYVPQLGLFAQTDPIGQADDPNPYVYVHDDPVKEVDPLGLCGSGEVRVTTGGTDYAHGADAIISIGYCVALSRFDETDEVNLIRYRGGGISAETKPTAVDHQDKSSKKCTTARGPRINLFEKDLNYIANLADTASTVSLFLGQPEIALGFTAVSFTATSLKAGSQWYRGDVAGAEATAAGAAVSFGISRISNVVRIGGMAQKTFNAGVASGLGQLYGNGLTGVLGCP